MRFIEFVTTSGRRALINPDHVALLTSDSTRDVTSIYFVGDPQPLFVNGSVEAVRTALLGATIQDGKHLGVADP